MPVFNPRLISYNGQKSVYGVNPDTGEPSPTPFNPTPDYTAAQGWQNTGPLAGLKQFLGTAATAGLAALPAIRSGGGDGGSSTGNTPPWNPSSSIPSTSGTAGGGSMPNSGTDLGKIAQQAIPAGISATAQYLNNRQNNNRLNQQQALLQQQAQAETDRRNHLSAFVLPSLLQALGIRSLSPEQLNNLKSLGVTPRQ